MNVEGNRSLQSLTVDEEDSSLDESQSSNLPVPVMLTPDEYKVVPNQLQVVESTESSSWCTGKEYPLGIGVCDGSWWKTTVTIAAPTTSTVETGFACLPE
jgi:hypothetical protein